MKIIDFIRELVFPETCVICNNKPDKRFFSSLCCDCGREYLKLTIAACRVCGKSQIDCRCKPKIALKNAEYMHLFEFDGDFSRRLTYSLKKRNRAALRRFISNEISQRLKLLGINDAEITYAPRGNASVNKYGFDQSYELARLISINNSYKLKKLFVHTRRNVLQKTLSVAERAENAKQSFALNQGQRCESETLIIIDDVVTSGSTTKTLCDLARSAGAKRIIVFTMAKTVYKRQ